MTTTQPTNESGTMTPKLEKVKQNRGTETYRYGSWVITHGTLFGTEVWAGKLGNAMSFRVEGNRDECLKKLQEIATH